MSLPKAKLLPRFFESRFQRELEFCVFRPCRIILHEGFARFGQVRPTGGSAIGLACFLLALTAAGPVDGGFVVDATKGI
ncbi:hypothetical protein HPP92_016726 [Vanilla planifolia]|uniref:Uncharacterized protein n=1 Tax=Vanilla planifolia TaxID=51239 RepID=A0A835QFR3_VANPL|nr:hypothetical protein HPP92_016726 [Vanilla planifolia]